MFGSLSGDGFVPGLLDRVPAGRLRRTGEGARGRTGRSPRGLDPGDVDLSAPPCGDFYQYADGEWLKKNPVPADYPSWGAFNELDERNREILHQTLEKLAAGPAAPAGSEERKLADFYGSCMDEPAIEAAGITPLKGELDRIAAIHDQASLQEEIARLQERGVSALFQVGSEEDRKN